MRAWGQSERGFEVLALGEICFESMGACHLMMVWVGLLEMFSEEKKWEIGRNCGFGVCKLPNNETTCL